VIVASVHNRHKMDADQMTRRIVTAMRRPQFKIWGHALGRYVLTRPPFAVHMEKILDAVAESRAAVEINGDPHRWTWSHAGCGWRGRAASASSCPPTPTP
jgi:DNA polymerase (family 10)